MKSKLLWFSSILFIMGIAFGYFENSFYQYIDENDVLVESWFMPLALDGLQPILQLHKPTVPGRQLLRKQFLQAAVQGW